MRKQKVLIIAGPTASGKSALAVAFARKYYGEVVSADSRQVYRGLDIGTAKITRKEMRGVPHHLLDIISPRQTFTAFDFVTEALKKIGEIQDRGHLPIVAGGTGFYIDALVGRVTLPSIPPNPALRKRLEKKILTQLFALLKKRDPERARTIERHNKRRLIRALEIASVVGYVPHIISGLRNHYFDALWIGLAPAENVLKAKITMRIFARISRGMIAEAERLHAGGLSYKRMDSLGLEYRSLARLLQKKITRQQMMAEMKKGSILYAKRQMRYWKRNRNIKWFKPSQKKEIFNLVSNWLG